MYVTLMALGVKRRNFVNSGELASEAGRAAGPGGCGGPGCLWLHPLPLSNPYFFLLPILRFLSEESGRWLFLFQYWKEQTVNISSEYFQYYVKCSRVTGYSKLRLPQYLWVSVDGFLLPWKQHWWLGGYPVAITGTSVLKRAGVMIITLI